MLLNTFSHKKPVFFYSFGLSNQFDSEFPQALTGKVLTDLQAYSNLVKGNYNCILLIVYMSSLFID